MITVTVNDAAVNRQLQALASKVSDLSPVMAGLSEILLEEVRDNLANEHGPTGPWPRLSPRTVLRRALQHKWPGKMLQVSGALKNTLVPGHGARAAWVSAGTRRYAAIHQFGGQAGRGRRVTIPPRPYLHRFIPAGAGNGRSAVTVWFGSNTTSSTAPLPASNTPSWPALCSAALNRATSAAVAVLSRDFSPTSTRYG